jgi:hypothetical protein
MMASEQGTFVIYTYETNQKTRYVVDKTHKKLHLFLNKHKFQNLHGCTIILRPGSLLGVSQELILWQITITKLYIILDQEVRRPGPINHPGFLHTRTSYIVL